MKVLLISPPNKEILVARDMAGGLGFDRNETMVLPPLDLAYMASALINKGYKVMIIDAPTENLDLEETYEKIKEFSPDIIISLLSLPSLEEDSKFLKNIDKYIDNKKVKKIIKTSIVYPQILKEIIIKSDADFLIYGECETIIDEILNGRDKRSTAYLDNSGNLKIEEKYIIKNLDDLPLPSRILLPNDKYRYPLLGDNKMTTMQTSRGCPFPCAYYCPYPLVQGTKWRARNPENIIEEIKDIFLNFKTQKILFRDATFTLDKERTIKICDLIIENNLNIEWWCETRINCLDFELLKKMKKAGCKGINVGIETGDPEILKSQAKIGVDINKIKNIVDASKKLNINLHFLIMVGLPSETKRSLYKTFKLIKNLKPYSLGVSIITPYPGTPLFKEAQEHGWIQDMNWSKFGGHIPTMKTDNISMAELLKAKKMIGKGYYLNKYPSFFNRIKFNFLNYYFKVWSLI